MSTRIRDFVSTCPVFDHHDHLVGFDQFEALKDRWSADTMIGYAGADFVSAAGPRPSPGEDPAGLDPMWPAYASTGIGANLWPKLRNTGYARAVDMGCRALFGLSYDPANWPAITEQIRDLIARRKPADLYDEWLRGKAGIRETINDALIGIEVPDPAQFPPSFRFTIRWDGLCWPDRGTIAKLERIAGRPVGSAAEAATAFNAWVDRFLAMGKTAAFKVGTAYIRDLRFGDPSAAAADAALSRLKRSAPEEEADRRVLGDWMLHRLLERADAEDLPVQFHTGYLAGNWLSPENARAILLVPLFRKYRRVRFDVFHASFPYSAELGALAKNFPNVYLDMCWAWTMSPSHAERALSEWLDEVPFTHIFGIGADTFFPACAVGYVLQARRGIARVLEAKVSAGDFDESLALDVAKALTWSNGEGFYPKAKNPGHCT